MSDDAKTYEDYERRGRELRKMRAPGPGNPWFAKVLLPQEVLERATHTDFAAALAAELMSAAKSLAQEGCTKFKVVNCTLVEGQAKMQLTITCE